jgi:hypothetical protein
VDAIRRRIDRHATLVVLLVVLSAATAAQKPQPLVVGHWASVPKSAPINKTVDVALRITPAEDAPSAEIQLIPSSGVTVVSGPLLWKGPLKKDQVATRRYKIRVVKAGDWTLGASITNRRTDDVQVSGAVLRIQVRNGIATFADDTPAHSDPASVKK